MYLKKVEGPRAVSLPDGTILSHADLPPPIPGDGWPHGNRPLVRGVAYGLITRSEAMATYGLSVEEFGAWVTAVSSHGEQALKVTALKDDRPL